MEYLLVVNWQEGDPLSPTNLNSRIPSWVSTSSSTAAIAAAVVANLPAPVYNVKTDFGAVGDGVTDDHAAIQAALDAASSSADTSGTKTVYFPAGTYLNSLPLWVTGSGVQLVGSYQGIGARTLGVFAGASNIKGNYYGGVGILAAASSATVSNLVAPLVTGTGNSFQLTGHSPWFNLRDCPTMDINGKSALCVEAFHKTTEQVQVLDPIVTSFGRWMPSDALSNAFVLCTSSGKARFTINLSTSGVITITDPAQTLSDGNVHHIAGTYDGSTVRLFLDGALVASSAGTGTVVQGPLEEVIVGATRNNPPEQDQLNDMAGTTFSVRIRDVAGYTAAFTAPNSQLALVSNTLALLNLDLQRGPMTRIQTSSGDVWSVQRVSSFTPGMYSFGMRGLTIDSGSGRLICLYLHGNTEFWFVEHCAFISTRTAIYGPFNNKFQWSVRNCLFQSASTGTRFGIALGGNGGAGHMDSVWDWGSPVPVLFAVGSNVLTNVFCNSGGTQDGANVTGFVLLAQNLNNAPTVMNGCVMNTEAGVGPNYRAAVMIAGGTGTGGVMANGCAFETARNAPHVIADTVAVGKFTGCVFSSAGTQDTIMHAQGTFVRPFAFDACAQQNSPWIPWSNVTGTAVVGRMGTQSSTSTGGTILFDASKYDDWDLTLGSDVTTSTWTRITYGQRLVGAIKMDSTGSRLFTWPTNSKGTVTLSYGSSAINTFAGFYDGTNVILTSVRTGL